jgi:hypothetical protein
MSDTSSSIASELAALRAKLYAPGFMPMTPEQLTASRRSMMASLVIIGGAEPTPEPIAPPATAEQKKILSALRRKLRSLEKLHEKLTSNNLTQFQK